MLNGEKKIENRFQSGRSRRMSGTMSEFVPGIWTLTTRRSLSYVSGVVCEESENPVSRRETQLSKRDKKRA